MAKMRRRKEEGCAYLDSFHDLSTLTSVRLKLMDRVASTFDGAMDCHALLSLV